MVNPAAWLINRAADLLNTRKPDERTEAQRWDLFTKPSRKIHTVFIHCSASDRENDDDISVIKRWHLAKGWRDVGYHYFIRSDGTVQYGRPPSHTPAAQRPYNKGTLAICLHGGFKNAFTEEQFDALRLLCRVINAHYDGKLRFRGHCEVARKACPVFLYKDVLNLDERGRMREERAANGIA